MSDLRETRSSVVDNRPDHEVCTCEHSTYRHAAQAPHWCTVKGCGCPTLWTKDQARALEGS